MKKTRVPRGEKYWYIGGLFEACIWIEDYSPIANKHFENNNYFHTKEEAETMSRKLRAVLAGADVIEMPSEEEIDDECDERRGPTSELGETKEQFDFYNGFIAGTNYLKSKIVK